MRGVRSTLILLVVLGGLLGYIYFVESKKPDTPAGEEAKPKVFAVAADKIAELSVKPAAGDATVLRKTDGQWQIVRPLESAADEGEVSGIASNLASLEIQRVVDEAPRDLKQYGLAQPRVDISFKAAGDTREHHLLVGEKTPAGGELYAKLPNEKKVFLISGYLDTSLNKSTFDLRDKSVMKFDRNKVDSVVLDPGDKSKEVQLAKAGDEWTIAKPVAARADYGTVEGLIGRLQTAQMKSLVTPEAKDLKEYGLDKPEASATLGAGSARATLDLGKKSPDGTVYARDAARPMIFTVEASLLDELKKPGDDYRRKDVFESRPYNTERVEITRGTDSFVFEKVKGQGKDAAEKWRQVGPTARDVDSAKMDGFLTKLTNMRVQSWGTAGAKTGTDQPTLTTTIKFDEGKKQEHVVFGKAGSDVYASRTGEPGAAKVDATEFDDALKALDALK